MLADYFIEKRKDLAQSQSLLQEMNKSYEKADFGMFE